VEPKILSSLAFRLSLFWLLADERARTRATFTYQAVVVRRDAYSLGNMARPRATGSRTYDPLVFLFFLWVLLATQKIATTTTTTIAEAAAAAFHVAPQPGANFGWGAKYRVTSRAALVSSVVPTSNPRRRSGTSTAKRTRLNGVTPGGRGGGNGGKSGGGDGDYDSKKQQLSPATLVLFPLVALIGVDLALNVAVLVKRTVAYAVWHELPSSEPWW